MAEEHKVASHEAWMEARKRLLIKEKEFTRLRDQLSQERRDLPWEPIEKEYVFEGLNGKETLPGLFDGRSQLIIYHFMFGPDWEAGCPHCSRWADNFNGIVVHLNQRDVSLVAVSRAPYGKLAAYRKRMGWNSRLSGESHRMTRRVGADPLTFAENSLLPEPILHCRRRDSARALPSA